MKKTKLQGSQFIRLYKDLEDEKYNNKVLRVIYRLSKSKKTCFIFGD